MGYIRHNAIVVTSWDALMLSLVAETAKQLGLVVIGPSPAVTNRYSTLLICPDGSKEGWRESTDFNEKRYAYRLWLSSQADPEDGSSCLEWVELCYGNDDGDANIVNTAWDAHNDTDQ